MRTYHLGLLTKSTANAFSHVFHECPSVVLLGQYRFLRTLYGYITMTSKSSNTSHVHVQIEYGEYSIYRGPLCMLISPMLHCTVVRAVTFSQNNKNKPSVCGNSVGYKS